MVIISQIRNHLRSKLIINTYLIMAMRLFGPAGGFVFWALAARTMTAEEIGLASGVVAGTALLARLAQLGLGYGLVRYLPHSDNPGRLLNLAIWAVGVVGFALALIFLAGLSIWSPALLILQASLRATIAFVVLVVSTSLSQLLNWAFLARRRPVFSLAKNTIQTALAVILLILLTARANNYLAVLTAYMLATVCSLGFSMIAFLPRSEPGYRFRVVFPNTLRSPFTTYVLSSYVTDQVWTAPDSLMSLLVVNVLGPDAGAYFFVVWAITSGLIALAGSVSASFFAEGANKPELASTYAYKSLKVGLFFASALTLAATLFGKIILALYGQDYVDNGALLLVLLSASIVPAVVLSIYVNLLRIRDRIVLLVVIAGLDTGLGLLLTYLFMAWFGLLGTGIGWLVSQFVMLACVAVLWKWQQIHPGKMPDLAHRSI